MKSFNNLPTSLSVNDAIARNLITQVEDPDGRFIIERKDKPKRVEITDADWKGQRYAPFFLPDVPARKTWPISEAIVRANMRGHGPTF